MGWKGLLLDVDGTLVFRGKMIPGAAEALAGFRVRGLRLRFATNIDSRPPESVRAHMVAVGLDARHGEVINPPLVALRLMQSDPRVRWHCLVGPDLEGFLLPHASAGGQADGVLVGYCPQVDYRALNEAFRQLVGGAELVALQKGRYFFAPDGISLDTGAVVAALEYATGKRARVLGKPAREFFTACLEDLGLAPDEVAVVGDDPTTDVVGARAVGASAILVRTGRSSASPMPGADARAGPPAAPMAGADVRAGPSAAPMPGADARAGPPAGPDLVVDSIADLLRLL